jgi:hypothetical protein
MARSKAGLEFNPNKRAFTGGVGKPTKARRNDGRQNPDVQSLTPYPIRPTGIFNRLEPYANNSPVTRVVIRAPKHLTPSERKRWHKLRKLGVIS